jgi:hypothetical protein
MAMKIIKHRLFTWFEEVESTVHLGQTGLVERIAHLGEEVDITNPTYVARGEELGSFYTDAEAKEIKAGTYNGPDAEAVYRARESGFAQPVEPVEGEGAGLDFKDASSEEVAEYIKENKLSVPNTLALLPADADEDDINTLYDAEGIASENDPRKGVTDALDAKLAAITAGK